MVIIAIIAVIFTTVPIVTRVIGMTIITTVMSTTLFMVLISSSTVIMVVILVSCSAIKGTLLGTPNREPQECSRNIMEYKDSGKYMPIIYLLYSWGSLFGVPSRVPLAIRPALASTTCDQADQAFQLQASVGRRLVI